MDFRRILTAYVIIHMAASSFWPRHTTLPPQAEVTFTHIEALASETSYGLDVTYPSHGLLQVIVIVQLSSFMLASLPCDNRIGIPSSERGTRR
jgi:hypothetical protein